MIGKKAQIWECHMLFSDAMHQIHNSESWYAWQERGKAGTRTLPSNTGRQRLNITGAYDPLRLHTTTMIETENCTKESTKRFFDQLRKEEIYQDATIPLHLFLDNAKYQKAYEVQEYAKEKNIILEYLPAYSPNLNLIERFWKYTKKVLVINQYYETFDEFRQAFEVFFSSLDQHQNQLQSLLTLKFEIIGNY